MWVWKNGEFLRKEELTISPYDHGFLYGLGFFETFRTYNNLPFCWDAHVKRLHDALQEYRIAMPYALDELLQVIRELNEKNEGSDGYFRLNVTAGVHDIGLQPSSYERPTVILFRKELPNAPRGTEKTATIVNVVRNTPEASVRHKSHHYANNVLARFELPSLAEVEGILLTQNGHVAEGITSNVFWTSGNTLFTPAISTGILPGVIREWVLNHAESVGLSVRVGEFSKEVFLSAEEVFLTNSIQEIVPIRQLGDHLLMGNEGPIYQRLHALYQRQVEQL
ncbi:aminodeoxychorismate lyase [Paenisporosarcina cavernae]|uniref:4-amino-4-deoxychorismate lyase n=1 Tax=Paenisporosarcina cavernae TaxID=2320858 RepID=A0A385YUV7_9BACL|nr:aminodeoxychorismate lyase [Paenisporosarcina cavernae]AYC30675.1 4-amino-4-deoxychorismate lyase [Paenisporosarcina cavernae]